MINRNGIQDVIELNLDEKESEQFAHSAKVLRDVMKQAELVD